MKKNFGKFYYFSILKLLKQFSIQICFLKFKFEFGMYASFRFLFRHNQQASLKAKRLHQDAQSFVTETPNITIVCYQSRSISIYFKNYRQHCELNILKNLKNKKSSKFLINQKSFQIELEKTK